MSEWLPILRPVRQESGDKSYGGVAVCLTDGTDEHELMRVAFARDRAKNPDLTFGDALLAEIEKAELAADVISEHQSKTEAARALASDDARDRIREIVKPEGRSKKMA